MDPASTITCKWGKFSYCSSEQIPKLNLIVKFVVTFTVAANEQRFVIRRMRYISRGRPRVPNNEVRFTVVA